MSTIEKINNAALIKRHWRELNNKVYFLCDKLDATSGKVGREEQTLISEIGNLTRTILKLKQSPHFNPIQNLETFDGTTVSAESAIAGALMMLKDLESTCGCNFQIDEVGNTGASGLRANKDLSKVRSRIKIKKPFDFGRLLLIIGLICAALYFFFAASMGFINGTTGVIGLTLGLILGVVCSGLSLASAFIAYNLIKEKQ